MDDCLDIWGFSIPLRCLSLDDIHYIKSLPTSLPDVKWVWGELDRVWAEYGLDNKRELKGQSIAEYYRHPVWLINGIFTALDIESKSHRASMAKFFSFLDLVQIADYGGGFGELALAITRFSPKARVSIIEPYPSKIGIERISGETRIEFSETLARSRFDVAIAQDVLEHVEDPIGLAYELADAVKINGYIVFANCFSPVIQCHLPSTFHLRHTFPWVMGCIGLSFVGNIPGASHVQVFKKCGRLDLEGGRKAEAWSRKLRPISAFVGPLTSYARKRLKSIDNPEKLL